MAWPQHPVRIAAIVPCLNEASSVGHVIDDLLAAVPGIAVYVYDNRSTDATADVARAHGALVRHEPRPGKGNVVRRAFADVEADVYVLLDGDNTYEAAAAGQMVHKLITEGLDHVVGARRASTQAAYRPGHVAGNKALTRVVATVFGQPVTDMLSGYRVMSRRFVKSFPAISRGFEVETELTVHAINLRVPQAEVLTDYRDRLEGSTSKLRTYRDGWAILRWIVRLARYERPTLVHSILGGLIALVALVLGVPVVVEFFQTGLVPKFPTAILASALVMIAVVVTAVGVILEAIRHASDEASRLVYLEYPSPHSLLDGVQADVRPVDVRRGTGAQR
ncbi:glycosyltransferase [Kineococcus rhizosphaerae]|uniref:Glycosyltransferase involved in cell wall biosynthesis n=1 Tax=Kineococcus rhizosphaerae TaxID=559628 RepID=A0A2T0R2D6_9ACTN|nr:glycosyltransferase [Kineococcus rhizosphaerae]PRY13941.1 glycosyltransferase involved in cell wall biosynthesis [Kineococcus rhizosphaerae]